MHSQDFFSPEAQLWSALPCVMYFLPWFGNTLLLLLCTYLCTGCINMRKYNIRYILLIWYSYKNLCFSNRLATLWKEVNGSCRCKSNGQWQVLNYSRGLKGIHVDSVAKKTGRRKQMCGFIKLFLHDFLGLVRLCRDDDDNGDGVPVSLISVLK